MVKRQHHVVAVVEGAWTLAAGRAAQLSLLTSVKAEEAGQGRGESASSAKTRALPPWTKRVAGVR